jgi:tetratricopeptide (TPR) repeat protein
MFKFIPLLTLIPIIVLGQEVKHIKKTDNLIFKGNQAFDASNGAEAERNYRRAEATGQKKDIAQYNMGTTLQKQNYTEEALNLYSNVVKTTKERSNKHRGFHNIGNALIKAKDYQGAVEAYKNALRNNPSDDETRYNYALAKKMLEDQKEKEDKDNDQSDNQDKSKDKEKDKDKGQNDKKDKSGDNKGDNKKEDEEKSSNDKEGNNDKESNNDKDQQPPPKPNQLSPQQIKNLLDAMSNEEKKVQDKVNAKKVKAKALKTKKDW